MNQKKCPKCGENNPAEAVMCWACYTPLTGGGAAAAAPAGMAAKGGGKAAPASDGTEKKGIGAIPPWQIGVLVVALVLAVGVGIHSLMGSSSSGDDSGTVDSNTATSKKGGGAPPPSSVPPPSTSSGPSNNSSQGGGGGGSVPAVGDVPFVMVSSPNPRDTVATEGIMPRNPPVTAAQAKGVAAFARRQILNIKHYTDVYIYVFNDSQSANTFREYQAKRHQAALGPQDYQNLSALWNTVPARYYYRPMDGRESAVSPSDNPDGNWWVVKNPNATP